MEPNRGASLPDEDTVCSAAVGAGPVRLLATGRHLDQFAVLDLLGAGGMGQVYRGYHVMLKKAVAIKVLLPELAGDERAAARFRREIRVVSRLSHPNIVRFENAGVIDGLSYLVMELVTGVDLEGLVRQLGPLPVAEACQLIGQAAVGLGHAHGAGLVHRDVKPSNLMLSVGGAVKVLDLGVAVLVEGSAAGLSGSQYQVGTAEYLAPEQARDPRTVDMRSDVYSLGCTLFKVLTGRPPFPRSGYDSVAGLARAHAEETPPALATVRPGCPGELVSLVGRMLAKRPEERPQEMAEVARALAPLAEGCDIRGLLARVEMGPAPVPSREPSPVETARYLLTANGASAGAGAGRAAGGRTTPARRGQRWAALTAAGVMPLVLGVFIGFLVWGRRAPSPEPRPPTDVPGWRSPALVRLEVVPPGCEPCELRGVLVDPRGQILTAAEPLRRAQGVKAYFEAGEVREVLGFRREYPAPGPASSAQQAGAAGPDRDALPPSLRLPAGPGQLVILDLAAAPPVAAASGGGTVDADPGTAVKIVGSGPGGTGVLATGRVAERESPAAPAGEAEGDEGPLTAVVLEAGAGPPAAGLLGALVFDCQDRLLGMAAEAPEPDRLLVRGLGTAGLAGAAARLGRGLTRPFPAADPAWVVGEAVRNPDRSVAASFAGAAFLQLLRANAERTAAPSARRVSAQALGLAAPIPGAGPLPAVCALAAARPPEPGAALFGQACRVLREGEWREPWLGEVLVGAGGTRWPRPVPEPDVRLPYAGERMALLEEVAARPHSRELAGLSRFARAAALGMDRSDGARLKQALELGEEAAREFAEVAHPYGGTLAEAGLLLQQWLAGPRRGEKAPEIGGPDLVGVEMKLRDFLGKVVLLDFWMDECPPCQKFFEFEKGLLKKYEQRPLVLVGFNGMGNREQASRAVATYKLAWPSWHEPYGGPVSRLWLGDKVRTIYVLDHEGVVRFSSRGYSEEFGVRLDALLEALVTAAEKPG